MGNAKARRQRKPANAAPARPAGGRPKKQPAVEGGGRQKKQPAALPAGAPSAGRPRGHGLQRRP